MHWIQFSKDRHNHLKVTDNKIHCIKFIKPWKLETQGSHNIFYPPNVPHASLQSIPKKTPRGPLVLIIINYMYLNTYKKISIVLYNIVCKSQNVSHVPIGGPLCCFL